MTQPWEKAIITVGSYNNKRERKGKHWPGCAKGKLVAKGGGFTQAEKGESWNQKRVEKKILR